MATIEINGQTLEVEAGEMLIRVADRAGIYIPRFCYHDKLSIAANCRMCLVEVEKAPKPLPACATPVTDGMKVQTQSALARDAQKGTMEFLLINHPLDCPICDQGGECDLQDLAVGYGKDVSRYAEKKRVVGNKDLGPLISTDMTRCIHCTRCVRFGQELAGVMELGAAGRGEHTEIMAFVGHTVDSELSGNVIDLCPVGALTSKPFRFACRSWELKDHAGISPHDTVGANLRVQVLRDEVRRVLPADNEAVNECWLADRDRFGYLGLEHPERLLEPRIKVDGEWKETDWRTALDHAALKLKAIVEASDGDSVGALVAPTATLEEFHLLGRLMQGIGSGNIDYRLRQRDFRGDAATPAPLLGGTIADLEQARAILLIGSNLRKEQPLLGLRLRKAGIAGAAVHAVNPVDYDFTFPLANRMIVSPPLMPAVLARLAVIIGGRKGKPVPDAVTTLAREVDADEELVRIANSLVDAGSAGQVLTGTLAAADPDYSVLLSLAALIAGMTGARNGRLAEANGVAGWHALAGARGEGANARDILTRPLPYTLLFNIDPAMDCLAGEAAIANLRESGMVLHIGNYRDATLDELAHVMLPLASYTESDGSYVNCAGTLQRANAAVPPPGSARPGWKILRVLGNYLGLEGFEYTRFEEVAAEARACLQGVTTAGHPAIYELAEDRAGLSRVTPVPLYRSDPVVRRAAALQQTADSGVAVAAINPATLAEIGGADGARGTFHAAGREIELAVSADERVATGCVVIPAAREETVALADANDIEVHF